jgi:ketosteroid isomerase-like protein
VSNVETVQAIYEAFGRGDIPAILERLDENVGWDIDLAEDGPPWLRPRRGRDGVTEFFQVVGAELEFARFEPYLIVGDGAYVVAMINLDATVKATGGSIADPAEGHLWTFDDDGMVIGLRHLIDTRKSYEAWKGE